MHKRNPEGAANWKLPVGELSEDECHRRWCWITELENGKFDELAESDEEAYIELVSIIESATAGLLPTDETETSIVNHPLNKNFSKKWGGTVVPWIAEWKADSNRNKKSCYRVYFTDALGEHGGVSDQMLGLLFREYPNRAKKKNAQSRDIDQAITMAKNHRKNHGCELRTMHLKNPN